jgi:hypothetical protein
LNNGEPQLVWFRFEREGEIWTAVLSEDETSRAQATTALEARAALHQVVTERFAVGPEDIFLAEQGWQRLGPEWSVQPRDSGSSAPDPITALVIAAVPLTVAFSDAAGVGEILIIGGVALLLLAVLCGMANHWLQSLALGEAGAMRMAAKQGELFGLSVPTSWQALFGSQHNTLGPFIGWMARVTEGPPIKAQLRAHIALIESVAVFVALCLIAIGGFL